MKRPDPGVESVADSLGVDLSTLEITDSISVMLAIRTWERENIPMASSRLGIDLFLTLAQLGVTPDRRGIASLKKVYLTLPFSEKGMRLHIRRMEANGLLAVKKADKDSRNGELELTPRFWELIHRYVRFLRLTMSENNPNGN
jgi:hypothetical protein